LSDADRLFLHFLVGADEFGGMKTPDLIFYVKECRCHQETIRLMRKFHTGKIDKDLIEKHWNLHPTEGFMKFSYLSPSSLGGPTL
jgi:hypothetical protein